MASHQDNIQKLREFPAQLEARVTPLTDEQLDQREAEGEWTTRQIVHHLADSHMSANFRFRLPLTEPPLPKLPTYDQDAWAMMPDYRLPLESSLLILRGLHARWVALLEALPDDQWACAGVHPEWGEVSVEYVANHYADHCDNHMAQINRIGAKYGW
jgi:hypothetical protein